MLDLYYFPTATCGYKARLVLAEKGVDFTHRVLDRDAGDLRTTEYLKLNPNAVVPTMVHHGAVLIESSIIMVYTDEAFEGPALRPAAPLARARAAAWLKKADDHYLPAIGSLTYGTFGRKAVLDKSADELEAYYNAIPDPDRRRRRRSVVDRGIDSPDARRGVQTLDKMLTDLEQTLAEHDFAAGQQYGLADAALTPFVSRLDELGMDWMWRHRLAVANWWDRIRKRGSFEFVFGAHHNPQRSAGLRAAGEEARESIEQILMTD